MKLYNQILIGMAIGAVIGLTVGPKAAWLPKDTYFIDQAKTIALHPRPDLASPPLALPPKAPLVLRLAPSAISEKNPALDWAAVSFAYDKRLSLLDVTGTLAKLAQDGRIHAHLRLTHKTLPNGQVVTWPMPESGLGAKIIDTISPAGDLFMRLIRMVIVPLVFCSLVVGVAGLGDIKKLGRLGGRTLVLYMFTTAAAVTIGLLVAQIIQPGTFVDAADQATLRAQFEASAGQKATAAANAPSAIDNILSIVPENPIASLTNGDMLQIIFFALLFAIALTTLPKSQSEPVVRLLDTTQNAMVWMINLVMKVAPIGVAALVAKVVGQSGLSVLKALLVYSLTVMAGLLVLAAGVYGSLVRFGARIPVRAFLKAIRPAQLIAFSTSSSSATLPLTMECAEQKLGVSNPVASFVLPLGSTVNMDGTALYQGVAALFIAQVFGMDLSISDQLSIVLTATAASIGAAGVPGAGMITLAMVLTTADIPPVGVALILGVDRFLDMFRTAVNVTGDLAVTSVMAVREGEQLLKRLPNVDASTSQPAPEEG